MRPATASSPTGSAARRRGFEIEAGRLAPATLLLRSVAQNAVAAEQPDLECYARRFWRAPFLAGGRRDAARGEMDRLRRS